MTTPDEEQISVEAQAALYLDPRVGVLIHILCGRESLKSPEHVAVEILRAVDAGELQQRR